MIGKFKTFVGWAVHRPTVIVNMIGIAIIIIGGASFLIYQQTRSIDVLENWTIGIANAKEFQVVDGKQYAVFNPGNSFVFTSQSKKLIEATGTSTRMIVCDAVSGQAAREIQIDSIPANRPAGSNPPRDNGIIIPDVTQFVKLPRTCRLVIDVTYPNVQGTGRSWHEHAESEPFIVAEKTLDPQAIGDEIDELKSRLQQLEAEQSTNTSAATPNSSQSATNNTGAGTSSTTTNNTTNNNTTTNEAPVDDGFQLHDLIPALGGLGL